MNAITWSERPSQIRHRILGRRQRWLGRVGEAVTCVVERFLDDGYRDFAAIVLLPDGGTKVVSRHRSRRAAMNAAAKSARRSQRC